MRSFAGWLYHSRELGEAFDFLTWFEFAPEHAAAFEDLESREQIPVVPQSFRDQYRALIQEHIEALRTKFSEQRIDYAVLSTNEPLDRALFGYMSSREKMMRVR